MWSPSEAVTIVIIAANIIFSWRGFNDRRLFEKYHFNAGRIISGREYIRIISSGFLHANMGHLMFNMLALYSFSIGVGSVFGAARYLAVYFGSLAAGNLLALYINRERSEYRAVGASGAVSGVVYSSVIMFPDGAIGVLFLPFTIPSWLFGILFILISIFGIRSRLGNIGHEAHLGGAIAGLLITIALEPRLAAENPLLVIALLAPTAGFLYLLVKRPGIVGAPAGSSGKEAGRKWPENWE